MTPSRYRYGRIPAQLVAHILYFFSEPGDLVLDPMAGGGVVSAMQKKKILGVTSRYVMVLKYWKVSPANQMLYGANRRWEGSKIPVNRPGMALQPVCNIGNRSAGFRIDQHLENFPLPS